MNGWPSMETLSFDGPVSPATAAVLTVAALFIVVGTLWFERRLLGRFWTTGFTVLRSVAFVAAIWMLLQPSWVDREELVNPKRIVVLADNSRSMQTVDDFSRPEMRAWGDAHPAVSALERVTVDVGVATETFERLWRQSPLMLPSTKRDESAVIVTALDRASGHVSDIDDGTLGGGADDAVVDLAASISEAQTQLTRLLEADDETDVDLVLASFEQLTRLTKRVRAVVGRRADLDPTGTPDRTRADLVAEWLGRLEQNVLTTLPKGTRVERLTFDESVAPVGASEWAEKLSEPTSRGVSDEETGTNLTAAIDAVATSFSSDPPTAVVLVSEGRHNAPETRPPVTAATALGNVPIYTVGIGNADRTRDLVITRVTAPPAVAVNDEALVEVVVSAFDCDGESAIITLLDGDRVIEEVEHQFESDLADANVQFRIPTEQIGVGEYQLRVSPLEDEQSDRNNVAAFSIQVTRGETRVLLADSQARWEYRYLQLLFARDEKTQFDEFLLLPEPNLTGEIASLGRLPTTVDEWRRYDVAILGDLPASAFDVVSQDALREHVRTGGRVVIVAGQNHMPREFTNDPLFSLLPVQNKPVQVQPRQKLAVAPEGQLHPAMLIETEPLPSLRAWDKIFRMVPIDDASPWCLPRDSAHVLATLTDGNDLVRDDRRAREQPTWLCWHQLGDGMVTYLSSPSVYHLRFRSGDRYHHRFWGQLLRWTLAADLSAGNSLVRIRTDKTRYQPDEVIGLRVELSDASGVPIANSQVDVEIEDIDGEVKTVRLTGDERIVGRYTATVSSLTPGVYTIRPAGEDIAAMLETLDSDQSVQTIVTVESPRSREMLLTSADYPLLSEVATATGGQMVSPRALDEVLALLPLDANSETIETRTPIWDRWPLLWTVFGCLAIEWIVRRRKGLI